MGIIGWIAIGAVAGIIAKALYPGAEDIGIFLTILLGIGGACDFLGDKYTMPAPRGNSADPPAAFWRPRRDSNPRYRRERAVS